MPEAYERLQRLKEKTEANTTAQVIKSALRLYEYVIEESLKGNGFCLRKTDGKIEDLKIFL